MRITAAICTYDRYDLLDEALRSVADQQVAPDAFEILVIDNSPSAEASAAEQVRHAGTANLRWVHEPVAGLSNARNLAVRLARAPLIAFLDDDAVADTGWLDALARAFEVLGEGVGVVGGRVRPRWVASRPDWLSDDLLGYLSVVDLGAELRPLRAGEWVAGANIAYRTEALRQVGGFSLALGRVGAGIALMSNDEIELGDRLAAAGWATAYAPDAAVAHLVDPARATQAWFRRRIAWQAVSDFVRGPAAAQAGTPAAWDALKHWFAHRHPVDRTVRALAMPQDGADDLRWQMSAIYNSVTCLLGAVEEPRE